MDNCLIIVFWFVLAAVSSQSAIKFEPYAAPVKPFGRHSLDSGILSPKTPLTPNPLEGGQERPGSSSSSTTDTVTTKALPTPFGFSSISDVVMSENARIPTPDL